jgi:hypothetical protein
VDRPYDDLAEFPAWGINIPSIDTVRVSRDSTVVRVDSLRPPVGRYHLSIEGAFVTRRAGVLSLKLGRDVEVTGRVGNVAIPSQRGGLLSIPVAPGEHQVSFALELSGDDWRWIPAWGERDLFTALPTGLHDGAVNSGIVVKVVSWTTTLLVLGLLISWGLSAARTLRPPMGIGLWAVVSFLAATGLGLASSTGIQRWSCLALPLAAGIRVPARLQNWRGALLLVGPPWLGLFAARSLGYVGRFTLCCPGDDWLQFKRLAYQIFMEHRWLEGGDVASMAQLLYRWITGILHLAFGDSNVGALYLDVFGVLAGAALAFEVTRRFRSFRAGIVAGSLTLATFAIGPNWGWIGRGLSEITAMALFSLAALNLMEARPGSLNRALFAGILGTLGVFTRLNLLPLALGLTVFALPPGATAGSLWRPREQWYRAAKGSVGVYLACLFAGLALLAIRNWVYTGHLRLIMSEQMTIIGTGLGRSIQSLWSAEAWGKAMESVAMIVTVRDPPGIDLRSALVVVGFISATLGLLKIRVLRELPLRLAVPCIASVAGGLVARGTAYSGRFSIHLIPFGVSATICAALLLLERWQAAGTAVYHPGRTTTHGGRSAPTPPDRTSLRPEGNSRDSLSPETREQRSD